MPGSTREYIDCCKTSCPYRNNALRHKLSPDAVLTAFRHPEEARRPARTLGKIEVFTPDSSHSEGRSPLASNIWQYKYLCQM